MSTTTTTVGNGGCRERTDATRSSTEKANGTESGKRTWSWGKRRRRRKREYRKRESEWEDKEEDARIPSRDEEGEREEEATVERSAYGRDGEGLLERGKEKRKREKEGERRGRRANE